MGKQISPWLLYILIGFWIWLPAQESSEPLAGSIQEEELSQQVNPLHVSPRKTMRTFLEAFYQKDGDGNYFLDEAEAASCLDLSGIREDVRIIKARELVLQLKDVLDRTELVNFEKIPDESDGIPYVFLKMPGVGEVVIAPVSPGDWRFTTTTVDSLSALQKALQEQQVVQGVEVTSRRYESASGWLRAQMPKFLQDSLFFLEYWQWIGLFLIILAGIILDKAIVFFLLGTAKKYLNKRLTSADPELLRKSLRPVGLPFMALFWWLGLSWLGLPAGLLSVLIVAVKFVTAVAFVMVAYRLVDLVSSFLAHRAERTDSRFDDLLVPLISKSLKVFIVAFGIVFVADNLGTDVQGLLAGIGLGGLAVALAAKDTVGNLFGSLTVLLDRPFHVGDWVVIGNVEGTVEEVGFRSTRVRTFYNSVITLPNSVLISASVDNYGVRQYRRWSTKIGIAYNTPPEKIDAFCEGIRELIRRHPYTRKDYFHVYLNGFGDTSLDILLYVFFETPEWATELRERHRLAVDMLRLAKDLEVEYAFPTQTLYLRQENWQAPETAGDGYPGKSALLQEQVRVHVQQMVDSELKGKIPPPVVIAPPPGDGES